MKDQGQTENQGTGSELDIIKAKAKAMGVKHHHAAGIKKIQAAMDAHELNDDMPAPETQKTSTLGHKSEQVIPVPEVVDGKQVFSVSEITELQQLRAEKEERLARTASKPVETDSAKRIRQIKEAKRLVRVRISNMNPNKREWPGELYTVSNSVVGTIKQYVPFNNDEGWHIPQMILSHLYEKECQIFYSKKNADGYNTRHGRLIKELNIQELPALTMPEIQDLAQRQAMASGTKE